MNDSSGGLKYDAFISYSRKDVSFAKRLELDLEKYRPPHGIFGNRMRLNIFRDVSDLVGNELNEAILDAIRQSRYLIVICSPNSRNNKWVSREIESFLELRDKKFIVPVIVAGRPNHEVGLDGKIQDKAFGDILYQHFDEPLAADFRTVEGESIRTKRARHNESKFQIIALLLGKSKEELLNRQRVRVIRILSIATTVFILASVAFAWIAYVAVKARKDAELQAQLARRGMYNVQMARARESYHQNPANAIALLDDTSLAPVALRNYAWSLLYRFAKRDKTTIINPSIDTAETEIVFSPDGNYFATSGAANGTIKIRNALTGEVKTTLEGHVGEAFCLSFSPDGRTLASGGKDCLVKLWNLQNGKELRSLKGHRATVSSVDFSPDGKQIASAGWDGTVKFWNPSGGKMLANFIGHTGEVLAVVFSPDNRVLATGGADDNIRIWDSSTYGLITTLTGHDDWVTSLTFSPDGKLLASASTDHKIKLWNTTDYIESRTLEGHSDLILAVTFSPDGNTLASAGKDNSIILWNVVGETKPTKLIGHTDAVVSVAYSPDGKTLASISTDETIKLWNMGEHYDDAALLGQTDGKELIVMSPDGKNMAFADKDNAIRLWDTSEAVERACLTDHAGTIKTLQFSPQGRLLVSADVDGVVKLWDTADGQERKELEVHTISTDVTAFSADGHMLAIAGADDSKGFTNNITIKLLDLGRLQGVGSFAGGNIPDY